MAEQRDGILIESAIGGTHPSGVVVIETAEDRRAERAALARAAQDAQDALAAFDAEGG